MKKRLDVPVIIYVACFLLATIFWFVLLSSRMGCWTSGLCLIFLPLTGFPYILWVVRKEGQEPDEYFQDTYAGQFGLMWGFRIFMMVVISVLNSVAAIIILGTFRYVYSLFQ